jgi:hypothetical protein
MLLDTAALAWASADSKRANPQGVIFLGTPEFDAVRRENPSWNFRRSAFEIVNERGSFVTAGSILAAQTRCGTAIRRDRIVVERRDDTTYLTMRKMYGIAVDGDVSLSAFEGAGIRVDFPGRLLTIYFR